MVWYLGVGGRRLKYTDQARGLPMKQTEEKPNEEERVYDRRWVLLEEGLSMAAHHTEQEVEKVDIQRTMC